MLPFPKTSRLSGSRYCWFRCQKLSDFGFAEGLTPENACLVSESKKLRFLEGNESDAGVAELKCVNPRLQVHPNGKGHGDYYPLCTTNVRLAYEVDMMLKFCLSLILLPFSYALVRPPRRILSRPTQPLNSRTRRFATSPPGRPSPIMSTTSTRSNSPSRTLRTSTAPFSKEPRRTSSTPSRTASSTAASSPTRSSAGSPSASVTSEEDTTA